MIGLGFREHGGLDRVELVEVPDNEPAAGEVRIRLRAAAFNRLDRFVLAGIPGVPIERPHVLGSDGAGVVDAIGPGVNDLAVGDRVLLNPGLWDATCPACVAGLECLCRDYRIVGEHTQGTATESIVLPRRNVHRIPSSLTWEQAAAAPLVFQTAWRAIRTVGAVAPGETVAIIGAGGGVSTAAIQVARQAGARVVVVGRSLDKADACRRLGAEEVLLLTEATPLDRTLWEWSGKRGIDLIFDSVGSPTVPRSVRSVARGGRLVVIGATAGPLVQIDLRTLFWRQASIRGSTMATSHEFDAVLAELVAGRLAAVVDRVFDWSDGRAALARMDAPDLFGKVVLRTPG
jgi:NADPH:quinone reductase-like Zn-dependent oxidoreductase